MSEMDGVARIAAERKRQIEQEDYSLRHDRLHHRAGELAWAAECYVFTAAKQAEESDYNPRDEDEPPEWWPFSASSWNPSEKAIRNLEKAGALIAAEIDRLLHEDGGRA